MVYFAVCLKDYGENEVPANVITRWYTSNAWTNSDSDSIHIKTKTFENVIEEDAIFHAITTSATLICDDFAEESLGTEW